MINKEAVWFKDSISTMFSSEAFPMLDIGSGDKIVREWILPCLDKQIFKPIKDKNYTVYHLDLKAGKGVDIVGNISDKQVLNKIISLNIKSAMCTNFLEHVEDRETICKNILSIIPSGGYIFLSCPYVFPYHPDPIDTMFRPNVDELAELFPGTKILKSEILNCGNFFALFEDKKYLFLLFVIRMLIPFYKPKSWIWQLGLFPFINKDFKATCLILQKI